MNIFASLAALLLPLSAQAAVFDAGDILPKNAGAISGFGEILLSDPTSEGIEARGRYGLNEDWNVGAMIGTGTKEKNFRMGGEAIYTLLPDWEGQVGLSFLGDAVYLRRYETGGLQMRVGPLLHKRITGWGGLPADLHTGLFWQIEARQDHLTSGTQIELGSNFDLSEAGRYYMGAELGIKLAKTDSYILVGFGMRLGDLAFHPKEKHDEALPAQPKRGRGKGNNSKSDDYTDEDFKK